MRGEILMLSASALQLAMNGWNQPVHSRSPECYQGAFAAPGWPLTMQGRAYVMGGEIICLQGGSSAQTSDQVLAPCFQVHTRLPIRCMRLTPFDSPPLFTNNVRRLEMTVRKFHRSFSLTHQSHGLSLCPNYKQVPPFLIEGVRPYSFQAPHLGARTGPMVRYLGSTSTS